jgi:hypothetical protein
MSNLFIQNENIRNSIKKKVFPIPTLYKQNIDVKTTKTPQYKEYSDEPQIDDTPSRQYTYFDNIDQLVTEFDHCNVDDITKKLHVNICGYSLNVENDFPFLQYMMFLDNGKWSFPNIPFHCATNIPSDEDGQISPMHVYFENLCTLHMLEYVEIGEKNDEQIMESMFKGYVDSSTLDNTLYVFFDISKFHIKQNKDKRVMWITIDEMLNSHQCLGFDIIKNCYSVFYQDRALYTIQNNKGEIMEIPSTMFLCKLNDDEFVNVYNDFEEDEKEDYGYVSLIDERINHPVLGNFFFFSTRPFEYQSSVTKLRRFVGNTKHSLYILHPLSELQSDKSTPEYSLTDIIPSIVSYFSYPKDQEDSKDQEDDNLDKLTTSVSNESSSDEGEQKRLHDNPSISKLNDKVLFEEEIKSIMLVDSSSIYFQEYKEGSKIPFWCIKNSTDFVEV